MVSGSRCGQSETVCALFVTKCAFSAHSAIGVSAKESEYKQAKSLLDRIPREVLEQVKREARQAGKQHESR